MRLLYLSVVVLFLASCGKCREKFYCMLDEGVTVSLDGFSAGELDTIVVKWYEPGSNFTELASSQQFDSDIVREPIVKEKGRQQCYDILLEIPAAGKQYHLTDFTFSSDAVRTLSYDCEDKSYTACWYDVSSFKLDGIAQSSRNAKLSR